jgi:hypothetical protein
MGIGLFIALVAFMLVIVGFGLILIFRKPSEGKAVSFVSPDNSVVKVRSVDGEIEVEFFPSETGDTEAFDLGEDVEREDMRERTLIDMWLDPQTSVEQRRELIRQMSVNGNVLVWTGDPDYVKEDVGEDVTDAGYSDTAQENLEDVDEPVEVEVDPVTLHAVVAESEPEVEEDYQDSDDWNIACEAEKAMEDGNFLQEQHASAEVGMARIRDEEDEVNDRQKEFVRFMVESFHEGRLSRELLEYAQVRIGFIVDELGWTVERLRKEKERTPVYDPDPNVAMMSLERFEMYVREVVSENEVVAAKAEEVKIETASPINEPAHDIWERMEKDDFFA